ncbi:DNA-binding CsgD family transcriptional regulator [Lysinibacillus composti]|nr:helix-turn-helix transcriptional regulator [Lysinibacillus composti]MBM7608833.1 DNA-binding CsgD family transcriptional regulator [Lysinibacillus composti]
MTVASSWKIDVERMKTIDHIDKKLLEVMEVILSTFSLKELLLFRYSPIDHLAEGIFSITDGEIRNITSIRDDVKTIPAIYEAIDEQCPKYFEGINYHLKFPRKYIVSQNNNSLFVLPVLFNQVVIGYFLGTKFKTPFKEQMLFDAKVFSQTIGELFVKHQSFDEKNSIKLSKREYEVMKCLAVGNSSKEISSLLAISETTIKQYIKSVMEKTNTSNRTHAVAFLYQQGILK